MHTYLADNNGGVRELQGDSDMVDIIVDINAARYTFFTTNSPLETTREPFVFNKIA